MQEISVSSLLILYDWFCQTFSKVLLCKQLVLLCRSMTLFYKLQRLRCIVCSLVVLSHLWIHIEAQKLRQRKQSGTLRYVALAWAGEKNNVNTSPTTVHQRRGASAPAQKVTGPLKSTMPSSRDFLGAKKTSQNYIWICLIDQEPETGPWFWGGKFLLRGDESNF